jgi:hypothetical protein
MISLPLSIAGRFRFAFIAAALIRLANAQMISEGGAPLRMPETVVTAVAGGALQQADPALGTTAYTVGGAQISVMPLGDDSRFSQVLARTPGISLDSDGLVHFRNEDPYYQFTLNGVVLPSGIEGFSEDIDPRFVQSVSVKVGALPASYGTGDQGAIDLETKSGEELKGSSVAFSGGSHDTADGSFSTGGSNGSTDYFLTGRSLTNDLGIENPTESTAALHDRTDQNRLFGGLTHHWGDAGALSLIFGGADAWYQIPDNPDQTSNAEFTLPIPVADSSTLNETQVEQTWFEVLSFSAKTNDDSFQLAAVTRQSRVQFNPDENGDLYFNGVASTVQQTILTSGIQGDGIFGEHAVTTFRGGFLLDKQWARDDNSVAVFQSSGEDPDTGNPIAIGSPVAIEDNHSARGFAGDLYAQEEVNLIDRLTVNFGARLDWDQAYVNEAQLGPRFSLVWKASPDTVLHTGYARYFLAPPLESVSPTDVQAFAGTTNASEITADDPVKCERSDYFDAGLTHSFSPQLAVEFDSYYKRAGQEIDDGQFGAANIFAPYNYATATLYGASLAVNYAAGGFTCYGSLAGGAAKAQYIDSSEFEFDGDELAYIAARGVPLDQTQSWTGSAGVSYAWSSGVVYADGIYGSGQRNDFANQDHLPGYYPMNLGIEQRFKMSGAARLSVRLDLVNVFDQSYPLDDGTGIGVGAPRYGARRGFFGAVSWSD